LRSFGSVLEKWKGRGLGFDAIRVGLSISILCIHSVSLTTNYEDVWGGPAKFFGALLVPAFFAVSGFLVAGSAARVDLFTFLSFRVLRILPALATEVMLTAVVLGAAVSTLNFRDYVTSPEFWAYFANIAGNIHFTLPGVFSSNPWSIVNGSLWTIQPEIFCYLFMALAVLGGLLSRRGVFAMIALGILIALVFLDYYSGKGPTDLGVVAQAKMFLFFVIGCLAYLFRYSIPVSFPWAICSTVAASVLLQYPGFSVLAAIPVVYAVLFLGLRPIYIPPLFARGDYSYGIYLYAYPVQQVVIAAAPDGYRTWYINMAAALPVTIALAMLSWHFVERPFLRLKEKIKFNSDTVMRLAQFRFLLAVLLIGYAQLLAFWSGAFGMAAIGLRRDFIPLATVTLTIALIVALGGLFSVRSRLRFARPAFGA
jgi:peptidoglycan/LPS O-acetylase OafA/YrhL